MVVFDASTLLLLFRPGVGAPIDPSTAKPLEYVQERLSYLVATLEKTKTKIAIPTPALSELLVRAGSAGSQLIQTIGKKSVFRVVPFDILAAIEVAASTRAALDAGDKRGGLQSPWAKVKYDRQIVAIAKVVQATAIYSDDDDIHKMGHAAGINVIRVAALPLPPSDAQGKLALEPPGTSMPAEPHDSDELTDEELDEIIAANREDEAGES